MSLFRAFYGRKAELSQLVDAVRTARTTSRGSVVLVEGEAGIGKTRLVSQLRAATRAEPVAFLVGRCVEYLQAPYEAFVDALRSEAEANSTAEALRTPPARIHSSEEERARRFHLVESFLRRKAAGRGALAVVIEDLHWSDATSLDLFRHLAHRLDDTPTVLIGTYRGADLDERAGHRVALERLRHEGALALSLKALSDDDVRTAIGDAVPERGVLSEDLIRSICELAEGRPFIAEELLREALDTSGGRPGGVAVPSLSVQGHVHERLRSLSPNEQQILMYAAVIGRDFDVPLLSYLTESAEAEVLETIRKARRSQLVAEDAHSGRLIFRHALTRAILYRELLVTEVRTLHERIARALEDGSFASSIEKIAYHWWAGHIAERAVLTNETAGDRAMSIAALADAATFYERALDFAAAGSDTRQALLNKVVQAHNAAGHGQSCLGWCKRAVTELRAAGLQDEALRFALRAAHQYYGLGDLAAAKAAIEKVREELRELPVSARHFSAEVSLAMVLVAAGSPLEALSVLDRAESLDCPATPRERWRQANTRASAYDDMGRYADATASFHQALEIAAESGDADLGVVARNNLAVTSMAVGATRLAKQMYEGALEAAERYGLRGERGMIIANLAQCALQLGDLGESSRLVEQTFLLDYDRVAPSILGGAVDVRLRTVSDHGKARSDAWVEDLIERAVRTGSSELISATTGAVALAFLQRGDRASAVATVQRGPQRVSSLFPYWIFDATAEVGTDDGKARARDLLIAGGAKEENRAAAAHLTLFDARTARSRGDTDEATQLAFRAHDAFRVIEWPLEAAIALEVAGDFTGALAAYRATGATREVQRIEDLLGKRRTRSRASLGLSRREEEAARLILRGYSNRTVAEVLGIGERTVETHVASIYRKLGVKSRTELVARLAETAQ